MRQKPCKIALVGNPNAGKSSLFNQLTGLNQKIGNYEGVTVERLAGMMRDSNNIEIIDLPGIYSIFPRSEDEKISFDILLNKQDKDHPDAIVIVVDAYNLRRNLLLATQLIDLGFKIIIVLTMVDILRKNSSFIDIKKLQLYLDIPILTINARDGEGVAQLKLQLEKVNDLIPGKRTFYENVSFQLGHIIDNENRFYQLLVASRYKQMAYLPAYQRIQLNEVSHRFQSQLSMVQTEDIIARYKTIDKIVRETTTHKENIARHKTKIIDSIVLHPVLGIIVLISVLYIGFQSIFSLAAFPMDAIETIMGALGTWVSRVLPATWWSSLITDGIIAGITGVIIFVPQIMILFCFITWLEDSGYMARMSALMDRLLLFFGMNGKSTIPLMSGMACAVPAIMSTRHIEDKRSRWLTIMVTPLMSCSARLPVYTLLIGLFVPATSKGVFGLQGIWMLGLYLLGFILSLCISLMMSKFIKKDNTSVFVIELPLYRAPKWKNIIITAINKAKIFVIDAGKIIIIISVLLWALTTYGPPQKMNAVHTKYLQLTMTDSLDIQKHSELLENSYAGHFGKFIEPAIRPLGFNWKIGIAILSSFAAREVFVGTMTTIYASNSNNDKLLREKLLSEKNTDGSPTYTKATVVSLLLFYAIAMQCMSTLAITYRETASWKHTFFQLTYLTLLAYFISLIAFQLLK